MSNKDLTYLLGAMLCGGYILYSIGQYNHDLRIERQEVAKEQAVYAQKIRDFKADQLAIAKKTAETLEACKTNQTKECDELHEKEVKREQAILAQKERDKKAAIANRRNDVLVGRCATIKSHFDTLWDGNHRDLERHIKQNLNDPDSYEHIKTNYSDGCNAPKAWKDYKLSDFPTTYTVRTFFRARNEYNALIQITVLAVIHLKTGAIKEIKEWRRA